MMHNQQNQQTRYEAVTQRITDAEKCYDRAPESVQLLAVSKTRTSDEIRNCASYGQRRFGENYLQEALTKIAELRAMELEWHFIGPIQSNKTHAIAENFDWVHSIERFKIARRLSEQRPAGMAPLNICLQVNVSNEQTKSGVTLNELPRLANEVAALPRLKLRGLMAIPAAYDNFEPQRLPMRALHQAMERLNREGMVLDTLSMGMSGDLEAAIAEGATMVRIGTALFGPRNT